MTPARSPTTSSGILPIAAALCALAGSVVAAPQAPSAAGPPPAPQSEGQPAPRPEPPFVVRRYPQDRDAAIAVVGNRTLTLADLVEHIDARHYPGFASALEHRPEIQRMLQSDLVAPWVRHFADLEALRQTFGDSLSESQQLEQAQSAALKKNFEGFLEQYVEDRRRRGRSIDLGQQLVNSLLADFQLKNGLAAELQGMLDHLEPGDYNRAQLQQFWIANGRYFGGEVTMAHILVQHRDGGTGILLRDEGLARANAKLADIRARLRPDGSNFEDIARAFSDDTRSARDGGVLPGVHRFDDRLPAALCRAVWALRDGEVCPDVVETQYGWHLVKRIDFAQHIFVLFTDDVIPSIRDAMRRQLQEDRLLRARERTSLRLLL